MCFRHWYVAPGFILGSCGELFSPFLFCKIKSSGKEKTKSLEKIVNTIFECLILFNLHSNPLMEVLRSSLFVGKDAEARTGDITW